MIIAFLKQSKNHTGVNHMHNIIEAFAVYYYSLKNYYMKNYLYYFLLLTVTGTHELLVCTVLQYSVHKLELY